MKKIIKTAFISVFHKEGLEEIVRNLHKSKIKIFSTGGTADFIDELHIPVIRAENLTGFSSILGGRVKTLHPKIFGGILARRDIPEDISELAKHKIPEIDLVIVDLYPFEKTVASGASHDEIIEKIDIGGITLIRAAAKNYKDVLIIPCVKCYRELKYILKNGGNTTIEQRKKLAIKAFEISHLYDSEVFWYLYFNS